MKRTVCCALGGLALAFLAFAPTQAGAQLDNFKCYKVKDLKNPQFVATTRSLEDQFELNDGVFEAKKPFLLCNPAAVGGGVINNPNDHLTCYKIKGEKLAAPINVQVVNQLGTTLQLAAKKAFLLCVPSTKTLLSTL